jgi:hypothetical protein
MPRFHFDVDTPHTYFRDNLGEEHSDLEEAQKRAVTLLADIAKELIIKSPRAAVAVEVRTGDSEPFYRVVIEVDNQWVGRLP